MSPTVLSQCNTFLLHRIVNDRDQDLVRRLVPDALGELRRERDMSTAVAFRGVAPGLPASGFTNRILSVRTEECHYG
jgi:hypothetical protein